MDIKMKNHVLRFLAAIFFIFTTSHVFWGQSGATQKNLIWNSSFEEGEFGWTLWNEHPGDSHGEIDNTLGFSGNNSFYVENSGFKGSNLYSENIPCQPRTTYTISAYIKTTNAFNVFLAAWGLDEDEKVINYQINGSVKVPDNMKNFTRFSKTFRIPDNCRILRAHLFCYGGMVWWDNIQINSIDKDTGVKGPNLLDNPGFEKGMAGWNFWKENPSEAQGIIDNKTAKSGKSSFYVNNSGRSGSNLYSNNIPCKPGTTYVVNAWIKTKAAKGVELSCWGLENKDKTINYTMSDTAPQRTSLLADIITESIPIKPIDCSSKEIELILRDDTKGTYYLFATNLNPAQEMQAEIVLRGKFENIVDLCIAGKPAVPATYNKSTTILKVHLNPGQGIFLKLGKNQ